MKLSNRDIASSVIGLAVVKAFSMLQSLAVVPLVVKYLGQDTGDAGTWFSLLALLGLGVSFDLGIGNRLKNDVLMRTASQEDYGDLVADALLAQLALSVTICLAGVLYWARLTYGVGSPVPTAWIALTQSPTVLAYCAGVILTSTLRLSYFVLQATQRNAASAFAALVPQLAVLAAVVFGESIGLSGRLEFLAAVFFVATLFTYSLAFVLTVEISKVALRLLASVAELRSAVSRVIIRTRAGLGFFVIQVSIVLLYGANELFYVYVADAEAVIRYQYYFRPFSLFSVGFSLLSLPFWSAIRVSYVRRDVLRMRSLSLTIVLLLIPVVIALLPAMYLFQGLLDLWLGDRTFVVNRTALLSFGVFVFLVCAMHALSAVLSATDAISDQARVLATAVVVKVAVLVGLAKTGSSHDAVVSSTVVALSFVVCLLTICVIRVFKARPAHEHTLG